jgi:hypothetical protein
MLLTYNPHLTVYTHSVRGMILLNEIHKISLILSLTLYTRTKSNVNSGLVYIVTKRNAWHRKLAGVLASYKRPASRVHSDRLD